MWKIDTNIVVFKIKTILLSKNVTLYSQEIPAFFLKTVVLIINIARK